MFDQLELNPGDLDISHKFLYLTKNIFTQMTALFGSLNTSKQREFSHKYQQRKRSTVVG